mmetsp:Transcript_7080/g.14743  ORF Transcript_7080/g.14743 Transcript_7080/m.14743 type:complete len:215 (-) Transcript_7080:140-784(-)
MSFALFSASSSLSVLPSRSSSTFFSLAIASRRILSSWDAISFSSNSFVAAVSSRLNSLSFSAYFNSRASNSPFHLSSMAALSASAVNIFSKSIFSPSKTSLSISAFICFSFSALLKMLSLIFSAPLRLSQRVMRRDALSLFVSQDLQVLWILTSLLRFPSSSTTRDLNLAVSSSMSLSAAVINISARSKGVADVFSTISQLPLRLPSVLPVGVT